MMARLLLFTFILFCSAGSGLALDPYSLLESILPKNKQPRLLNSDDIPHLNPNDPQPLFAPEDDFNKDGTTDTALSGLYGFPEGGKKYYLLVGTERKDPVRYEKFFFKEYDRPVFIHKAGTTGEGDPGDQAFSISFCWDCDQGFDFYWSSKEKNFVPKAWTVHVKRFQKTVEVPAEKVPPDVVDKALQVVAALKDVDAFIKSIKERGGEMGVRVSAAKKGASDHRYHVRLYEKKEGDETVYDVILVDVKKMKVLKREKKDKKR